MSAFCMHSLAGALPQCRPQTVSRRCTATAAFTPLTSLNSGVRRPLQTGLSTGLQCPSNGATVFAMRHRKGVPKLGRPADQRKAMLRSMTTEVLRHGKITTTQTKAKALRKWVDKMIQLAKDGSLHSRRQALAWVYDKDLVRSLFEEVPMRYGERNGGYCRVKRIDRVRRGDATQMAVIELVE